MSKKITRRSFMKTSSAIGVSTVLGSTLLSDIACRFEPIDIAVAKSENYLENTKRSKKCVMCYTSKILLGIILYRQLLNCPKGFNEIQIRNDGQAIFSLPAAAQPEPA